jgi:lipopolysaccharide biosynthesis glycosyltransferase
MVPIDEYITQHKGLFFPGCGYITATAYARFAIPEILQNYDKVIYLDCDIVTNTDVADLFKIDLKNKLAGVVLDYEVIYAPKRRREYIKNVLGMQNPGHYFNSGVLILNTKLMRKQHTVDELLKKLKEIKTPLYMDQDILNIVLEGKVKILDIRWNFYKDILVFLKRDIDLGRISEEYLAKYKQVLEWKDAIIHFAGSSKPWRHKSSRPMNHYFWKYARMTPFYEFLLSSYAISYKKNQRKYQIKTIVYKILEKIAFTKYRKSFYKGKIKLYHELQTL